MSNKETSTLEETKRRRPIRWTVRDVRSHIMGRGVLCHGRALDDYLRGREELRIKCLKCDYIWPSCCEALRKGRWCPRCNNREKWTYGRARAFALSKGGQVVSAEPDDTPCSGKTAVPMKCGYGHHFRKTAKQMEAGSWCQKCAHAQAGKTQRTRWFGKAVIALANPIGVLVSPPLPNQRILTKERIAIRCRTCGEIWEPTLAQIQQGQGCPVCAGRHSWTVARARAIARERGGDVVTDLPNEAIIRSKDYIVMRCAEGHEWPVKPNNLDNGHWCEECTSRTQWTVGRMRAIVEGRNGVLFDSRADDMPISAYRDKFNVACEHGHKFQTNTSRVVRHWCRQCSGGICEEICRCYFESLFRSPFPSVRPAFLASPWTSKNLELDGFSAACHVAFEHQGMHHYTSVKRYGSRSNLDQRLAKDAFKRQRCREQGILLIEIPELYTILPVSGLREFIMDTCATAGVRVPFPDADISIEGVLASSRSRRMLMRAREYASSCGGECLSKVYTRSTDLMEWRCSCGNTWESSYGSVVGQKSWCPDCGRLRTTQSLRDRHEWDVALIKCRAYAASKGGVLLSATYDGCVSPLQWRCANGHEWSASPSQLLPARVRKGKWCPDCAKDERRLAQRAKLLERCQAHARLMKGSVQSVTVTVSHSPAIWGCECGNTWPASPNAVLPTRRRRGTWCPRCRRVEAGVAISRAKRK